MICALNIIFGLVIFLMLLSTNTPQMFSWFSKCEELSAIWRIWFKQCLDANILEIANKSTFMYNYQVMCHWINQLFCHWASEVSWLNGFCVIIHEWRRTLKDMRSYLWSIKSIQSINRSHLIICYQSLIPTHSMNITW